MCQWCESQGNLHKPLEIIDVYHFLLSYDALDTGMRVRKVLNTLSIFTQRGLRIQLGFLQTHDEENENKLLIQSERSCIEEI